MKKAVQIFAHSVRLVAGNLGAALRVSALPFLVSIAAVWIAARAVPNIVVGPAQDATGTNFVTLVLIVPVFVASLLVIAVSWHRFVLQNEPARLIPQLRVRPSLDYLGRGLRIAFVAILIAFPAGFVVASFAYEGMSPTMVGLMLLILNAVTGYVSLRLSVSLPAMAIGAPMSLGRGWRALRDHSATLIVLSVGLALLQYSFERVAAQLHATMISATVTEIVVNWVTVMVGLSVLTTLYGHYIEGRSLR